MIPLFVFLTTLVAAPLTFEQRSPTTFQTGAITIHPDRLTLGEVTLRFTHASPKAQLQGIGDPAPATYLSAGTRQTIRQYPKLALHNLYPGIDAIFFYGTQDHLEYDLKLAPKTSAETVRMTFEGATNLRLDTEGNLQVDTKTGRLTQKLPHVYQADGKPIAAHYTILPHHEVALRLDPHDTRQSLTIDPELAYLNTFGGSGSDSASFVATDVKGNIYVAGSSNSVDFPTTTGLQPKVPAPLSVFSNQSRMLLPVGVETHVIAVGGTADGSVLYAATPGGVYASSNHGATWQQGAPIVPQPISGGIVQGPTINGIAVDPVDPSRVFAATTAGLFFSSQGGQSWFLHNTGLSFGGNGFVIVTGVIASPLDRTILYATTSNPPGLFKSTDYGNTWHLLNPSYPGEPVPYVPNSPIVMALGPNGSDLYVVDSNATFLKSTDGGTTWQPMAQGLYVTRALLVDPANPSNIYTLNNYGFQKSTDGGQTFTSSLALSPVAQIPLQQLAMDGSGVLYASSSGGVYASTDGGASLTLLANVPNLHSLTSLGGQVYAGHDTPSVPYVIKWDPTGTHILYSTFVAGASVNLNGLQVDAQGDAILTGTTTVGGFPTITASLGNPPAVNFPSVFVIKLNADGTQLVYTTLLSGSKGAFAGGLALDSSGAVYITGQTQSPDFPTSANAVQPAVPGSACSRPQGTIFISANLATNAFVTKLMPDGSGIAWSTFLSGSCGAAGSAIAVDSAGQVVVGGYTNSLDFPASSNAYQPAFPGPGAPVGPPNPLSAGFITRLSAAGDKVLASTYLGGGYATQVSAIAFDSAGNVVLTGAAQSIIPGTTPGAYQPKFVDNCVPSIGIGPTPPYGGTTDAYVLKLDPTLSTARYLTYLGGGCNDAGTGIALDASGNTWITGNTSSPDFPLKSPFQGLGFNGHFVAELSADASQLLYSSGSDGASLALDPAGSVYLAGSRANGGGSMGGELMKIDPTATTSVVVDRIAPMNGFPPTLVTPFFGTQVVPGELVHITGRNLGPATVTNGQLDAAGRLPFVLANTSVLFDGIPAPIISVKDTEIVCFVPFEVSQTSSLTVKSGGQQSNAVRLGVTLTDPQILSISNADGTPNSAANPAKPGSVLIIYASGLGETFPLSVDGLVNSSSRAVPMSLSSVYLSGMNLKPQFVGAAPGQIAGIIQINVAIPQMIYNPPKVNISLNSANGYFYVAQ